MSAFLLIMIFVFLIMGISILLMPDLVPKTLPFGVRIPADYADNPLIKKMKAYFRIYVIFLLVIFLVLTIFSGIYEQIVILFSFIGLEYFGYYLVHKRIHFEKIRNRWYENKKEVVVAEIDTQQKKINLFLWTLPSIIFIIISIISLYFIYPLLPNSIPINFSVNGIPDSWIPKTPLNASLLIIIMATITVIFYILNIVILRSRIEIDPTMPEVSSFQANKFKILMIKSLSVMGWFLNITFLLMNFITWNVLSSNNFFMIIIPVIIAVVIVFAVSTYAGAQGSRLKYPSNGNKENEVMRDDDKYWIGGIIYFNRDDTAILVPKRFGIGWTINVGNIFAWVFIILIILLIIVSFIIMILVH